jgi:hypoxanthine phosphoribosyltransferase
VEAEAKFEAPTWNQIYTMLRRQAEKIRCSGFKPDVVVGVTRGGWIPARILADLLGIGKLATVGVEFYLGVAETLSEPVLTQGVSVDIRGKKVLLVDDVADTGKSLMLARKHLQQRGAAEIQVATVYYKPLSVVAPDYYEKETGCWVVFPWDAKENVRKILEHGSVVNVEVAELVKAGLPKQLVEEFLKEEGEAGKC